MSTGAPQRHKQGLADEQRLQKARGRACAQRAHDQLERQEIDAYLVEISRTGKVFVKRFPKRLVDA